ncbi:MAG: stp [Gammaproteobacteria bacterium]|jgi:MFS family permease|nr:stp [Gammaproteobacteria bacterium]
MENLSKYIALIGISLLSFTGFLDVTIVSTALPNMQASLHMSVTELQWVMNACFLSVSAFMASMGRVADIYGRRKVFYIGAIVFGLASLGAGLSTHALGVIISRAIQGITVAILVPVGVAIIQQLFEQGNVAKAMGIFGTITGAGLALGPVVGGALVTAFGWPSVFYVNLPFIVIGLSLCLFTVKESRSSTKMSLDWLGMLLLVVTISSLVFAVVEANNYGWDSLVIISSFIIFALSLGLFVIAEKKAAHPIMAPELFKNRVFLPAMLFAFAAGSLMAIILFINPLYLSTIVNQSTWMTGVYLFIIPLVVMLSSPLVGQINHRIGAHKAMIYGSLFLLLATLGQIFFDMNLNLALLVPSFILFGLAWAIVNQSPGIALGEAIHGDHLSVSLGALFSFYNIGAAVMLAVSVTLFHWRTMTVLTNNFQAVSAQQGELLKQFVSEPNHLMQIATQFANPNEAATLFKQAFMAGSHAMFWPLIALSLISLWSLSLSGKRKVATA